MEFETGGPNPIGLLRALQGEITLFIVILAITIGAQLSLHLVVARFCEAHGLDRDGERKKLRSARFAVAAAGLIPAAVLVWQAVLVASVNRMPRADAAKSAVYDQMKSLPAPAPQSKQ